MIENLRLSETLSGYNKALPRIRTFIDLLDQRADLTLESKINLALYQASAEVATVKTNHQPNPISLIRRAIPNVEQDLGIDLQTPGTYRAIRRHVFYEALDQYGEILEHLNRPTDDQ